MEARDAVKLLYQATLGPGHLVANPDDCLRRLSEERAAVGDRPGCPLTEEIGGGFVRLNLRAMSEAGLAEQTAARLFIRAGRESGSKEALLAALASLRSLAKAGEAPFPSLEVERQAEALAQSGYAPVSHSEAYRRAYGPAYRVIDRDEASFLPLFCAVDRRIAAGKRAVLAIDGPCGSGKTTLADLLADMYGCGVVRMDDFFLPAALRTAERLDTPGGNIHAERFLDEAGPCLREKKGFSYRAFDCKKQAMGAERTVKDHPLTVVEGSYSLRRDFRPLYDLTVFLTLSPEEQRARLLRRNGPAAAIFFDRWIPLENMYFAAEQPEKYCDFLFGPGDFEYNL